MSMKSFSFFLSVFSFIFRSLSLYHLPAMSHFALDIFCCRRRHRRRGQSAVYCCARSHTHSQSVCTVCRRRSCCNHRHWAPYVMRKIVWILFGWYGTACVCVWVCVRNLVWWHRIWMFFRLLLTYLTRVIRVFAEHACAFLLSLPLWLSVSQFAMPKAMCSAATVTAWTFYVNVFVCVCVCAHRSNQLRDWCIYVHKHAVHWLLFIDSH